MFSLSLMNMSVSGGIMKQSELVSPSLIILFFIAFLCIFCF